MTGVQTCALPIWREPPPEVRSAVLGLGALISNFSPQYGFVGIAVALLALFLLLLAQITYIQVVAADRLAGNTANAKRQLIAEYEVDRGEILAADGRTILAVSRRSAGELRFERRYPIGPLYAGITGYYSFIYGRSELEESFNDFLSGAAPQLLPRTLVDQILGRPKSGASIVTTIDPAVQEAAAEALGDQHADLVGEILALQLNRGHIDGDPRRLQSIAPPCRMVLQHFTNDPLPHLDNHAGFLEHRDEMVRRNQPFFRIVPAQEGLCSDQASALKIDLWLVVKHKFAILEGALQALV